MVRIADVGVRSQNDGSARENPRAGGVGRYRGVTGQGQDSRLTGTSLPKLQAARDRAAGEICQNMAALDYRTAGIDPRRTTVVRHNRRYGPADLNRIAGDKEPNSVERGGPA